MLIFFIILILIVQIIILTNVYCMAKHIIIIRHQLNQSKKKGNKRRTKP